jgi:aminoglycoside phosphotransferase (APT) family kinase protein
VDAQFPAWRGLRLRAVRSSGTVNAIFRLGEEFAVRLPLVGEDAEETRRELEGEAAAARVLLGRVPAATPRPVTIGEPGDGYPLPWSVQTWLGGSVTTPDSVAHSPGFAADLAAFIARVRAIDTGGATFAGLERHGRGGDLQAHDDWLEYCFGRSEGLLDVPAAQRAWARFRELPRTSADVMTHGDLMPANLLQSEDGAGHRLAGVLDCGGVGPADPALDLICAWHLFEDDARAVLRGRLACDDLEWERGRAWAFEQSMGALWYYSDSNPDMARMARRTLERLGIPAAAGPGGHARHFCGPQG